MKTPRIIASLLLLALAGSIVSADVVETKDGARIVGKVTQIDGATVIIDTAFAGTLKVKQSEVVLISTEAASNIRLSSGTVLQGTLSGTGAGAVTIAGQDGSIQTNVDKIVATWAPGLKDPEVVALQRAWTYEAALDIVGKTGNSEQLGTGFAFRAVLTGPQDKLEFYSVYDRQVTEGEISSDQFKAGVDYQNSFAGKYSWYLRDEAGFDRVKLIQFSNVAAAGLGYDFIKRPKHTFTGRVGVAHRFESYNPDPVDFKKRFDEYMLVPRTSAEILAATSEFNRLATKENVNSAGLDFGLAHALELKTFSVVTRISYVPAFEDFSDYRAIHETFVQLPLANPSWKLRLGLVNDYTGKPAPGRRHHDTTYYSRFVLTWK
ncbi:MAG: DUF481 domain-containing protein [Nibricoccus sp.]